MVCLVLSRVAVPLLFNVFLYAHAGRDHDGLEAEQRPQAERAEDRAGECAEVRFAGGTVEENMMACLQKGTLCKYVQGTGRDGSLGAKCSTYECNINVKLAPWDTMRNDLLPILQNCVAEISQLRSNMLETSTQSATLNKALTDQYENLVRLANKIQYEPMEDWQAHDRQHENEVFKKELWKINQWRSELWQPLFDSTGLWGESYTPDPRRRKMETLAHRWSSDQQLPAMSRLDNILMKLDGVESQKMMKLKDLNPERRARMKELNEKIIFGKPITVEELRELAAIKEMEAEKFKLNNQAEVDWDEATLLWTDKGCQKYKRDLPGKEFKAGPEGLVAGSVITAEQKDSIRDLGHSFEDGIWRSYWKKKVAEPTADEEDAEGDQTTYKWTEKGMAYANGTRLHVAGEPAEKMPEVDLTITEKDLTAQILRLGGKFENDAGGKPNRKKLFDDLIAKGYMLRYDAAGKEPKLCNVVFVDDETKDKEMCTKWGNGKTCKYSPTDKKFAKSCKVSCTWDARTDIFAHYPIVTEVTSPAEAKKACKELGSTKCKAVTCDGLKCSGRASSQLEKWQGLTTYLPSNGCYEVQAVDKEDSVCTQLNLAVDVKAATKACHKVLVEGEEGGCKYTAATLPVPKKKSNFYLGVEAKPHTCTIKGDEESDEDIPLPGSKMKARKAAKMCASSECCKDGPENTYTVPIAERYLSPYADCEKCSCKEFYRFAQRQEDTEFASNEAVGAGRGSSSQRRGSALIPNSTTGAKSASRRLGPSYQDTRHDTENSDDDSASDSDQDDGSKRGGDSQRKVSDTSTYSRTAARRASPPRSSRTGSGDLDDFSKFEKHGGSSGGGWKPSARGSAPELPTLKGRGSSDADETSRDYEKVIREEGAARRKLWRGSDDSSEASVTDDSSDAQVAEPRPTTARGRRDTDMGRTSAAMGRARGGSAIQESQQVSTKQGVIIQPHGAGVKSAESNHTA